jgi:hypothetical protein
LPAGNEKDGEFSQIDADASGKRTGLRIGIGLVENVGIGDGALVNG